MTLRLPEHSNQFHLRPPKQYERGKEDKAIILWMDTVFSFYEDVSLYKEKRMLCQDPIVLFLIEVPSSGLLGGLATPTWPQPAQGSHYCHSKQSGPWLPHHSSLYREDCSL